MSNPLTDARNSLWDAVNNWPALTGQFKEKFRVDDSSQSMSDITPSDGQMPTLVILGTGIKPDWETNEMQAWHIVYALTIFTPLDQPLAEQLVWEVIRAVWQSHAEDDPVPYVKRATGYWPEQTGQIQWKTGQVGTSSGIDAIQATVFFTLRINVDPSQVD